MSPAFGLRRTREPLYRVEHRQTRGEKFTIYGLLQQTTCNAKTHCPLNHVQDLSDLAGSVIRRGFSDEPQYCKVLSIWRILLSFSGGAAGALGRR